MLLFAFVSSSCDNFNFFAIMLTLDTWRTLGDVLAMSAMTWQWMRKYSHERRDTSLLERKGIIRGEWTLRSVVKRRKSGVNEELKVRKCPHSTEPVTGNNPFGV